MKQQAISVIDYGAGNIGSILNMVKKLGGEAELISTPEGILNARKLILPGVGHFDFGMRALHASGMAEALNEAVQVHKTLILGICLGAQLMCRASDEGVEPGLGWFEADVKRFRENEVDGAKMQAQNGGRPWKMRVPHMGWNYVHVQNETKLTEDLPENPRFYFVHSYYIRADHPSDLMFNTGYGVEFASGLRHENKYAVQFHPEKSHKFGLKLFENYLNL